MFWWQYVKPTYDKVGIIGNTIADLSGNLVNITSLIRIKVETMYDLIININEVIVSQNKRPRVYFSWLLTEQPAQLGVGSSGLGKFVKGPIVMESRLKATQRLILTPNYVDGKGNPTKPDGAPVWSCDNSDVLLLTVGDLPDLNDAKSFVANPAGLSCAVDAKGTLTDNPVKVTVMVDGDPDEAVEMVIGTATISKVVAGNIKTIDLVATAPIEQPDGTTTPATPPTPAPTTEGQP